MAARKSRGWPLAMLLGGFLLGALCERSGLLRIPGQGGSLVRLLEEQAREIPPETVEILRNRWYSWNRVTHGTRKLVVFTDLECPFCAKFDSSLVTADFAVSYVHSPLTIHPGAPLKHRMVECALVSGSAGIAALLTDFYFDNQSSAAAGALEAIESDDQTTADIDECFSERGESARSVDLALREDSALTALLPVEATPSFVIGSKLFAGAVDESVLEKLWKAHGEK